MFAESGLVYAMSSLAARGDQVWLRYLVREDRLFCCGQYGGPLSRGDCPEPLWLYLGWIVRKVRGG